jgi:hypothetical protein
MNGEVDGITRYVRNGGNDTDKGHDGSSEYISKAYASVTKAIDGYFYSSTKPLVVDVGLGTYQDNKINAGSRGVRIIG